MKPEILLLVPTLPEIEPFLRQQGKGYGPVVTGIGPYRCAAATQEAIIQRRPDMMILCGIAGRYPASALAGYLPAMPHKIIMSGRRCMMASCVAAAHR